MKVEEQTQITAKCFAKKIIEENRVNEHFVKIINSINATAGVCMNSSIIFFILSLFLSLTTMFSQVRTYYVQSLCSGLYLDVPGGSTNQGIQIVQWEYLGGSNQQWNFVPLKDGTYYIQSKKSGMYLDVTGGFKQDGVAIIQFPLHGGANQRWRLLKQKDGSYCIVSKMTKKYLDMFRENKSNGGKLVQWKGHKGTNQRWNLIEVRDGM